MHRVGALPFIRFHARMTDYISSYLNMNGCEEEGLYRVPGSGKDVKYWQMRFDKGECFGSYQ